LLSTSQAPTPSGQQVSSDPNASVFTDTLLFARRYDELPCLSNLVKQIFFSHIRIPDFVDLFFYPFAILLYYNSLACRQTANLQKHEPIVPDFAKKKEKRKKEKKKNTQPIAQ